ncbi:VWA domain-containing protein [Actinoallomurus purpureus]|uniref:vWA domain-containing protein n=1 Tax=Actinoallomurus purpureus TaxID=478114 RepID=UPI0020931E1A|nr:VWA domain-containing protein [Actinoallomurus purpureus]MCO6010696.1 VWA domain-containing protein [Actinoallomurus purpureus]
MSEQPDFSIRIDQNKYLPQGGQEVHAVVTVESTGAPVGVSTGASASEVIIIDTSGSMDYPRNKMTSAIKAAQAAVDTLRDGVNFAVVSGSSRATMVYPRAEELVPASARTRTEAKAALGRLTATGGTAMGAWLSLAGRLFARHPDGIRHAILLTDGKNQHETPEQLDQAVAASVGRFVCDCRGVGTDWEVAELRKVASALLGSMDMVASPEALEADFRAMTETAMGKAVADVALRVWTPQNAKLRFVKQVLPSMEDLTGRRTDVDERSGDYPLGAWGSESRDYHVCVEVPPGEVGAREKRVAWIKLMLGDQVVASGNVLAEWTDDEAQSTRINPKVAHYTGQAELAENIQVGLQARKEGDLDTATARLGRAVALAHESGNEAIAGLLGKVVDVDDPATGRVRLKKDVDKADEMSLDTRSTKTVRTRKGEG